MKRTSCARWINWYRRRNLVLERETIHIRPAVRSDLPAFEWEGEYRQYRWMYQRAMQEAERGRRMIFVAEATTGVIGQIFVQLYVGKAIRAGVDSAYFHSFRVRPAFRNRGVGSRLIEEAERAVQALGYERVVIAAAQDNPAALRLYQRLGFRFFSEDRDRWSYIDDRGHMQQTHEPSHLLEKWL
jgi:ribosomal protein S18 acetylase RimI-like enzyme